MFETNIKQIFNRNKPIDLNVAMEESK